jgi:L-amino acid N-acyltransferase YncA
MIIRPASCDDAAAIAEIYAHHVIHGTASFETVARSIDETLAKIEDCNVRGWPFLVAEAGGVLKGYAYATQFRDRPAYAFTCENSIYLDPDYLRRGIGSVLLAALIDAAEVYGFRQMIAVIAGGAPASVALHSRAGFENAGRMTSVGRKFGLWLDTVYMQRALGSGDTAPPLEEPV